jgi:hypothetical protein
MMLCFAGVFHFDPRCAPAVEDWFVRQVATKSSMPAFVANEWTPIVFQAVAAQRSRFRRLLETEWPGASPELLTILERSLAYEGDVHLSACPEAEVLWLGKEHPNPGGSPSYDVERLLLYRRFLGPAPLTLDTERTLELIGTAARKVATNQSDPQRDRDLASAIIDRAERGPGGWAAIVVGADHVSDREDSMLRVLQAHGYSCEVDML